ncbi:MAG: GNAT family N-acetyltransferase [Pseudomonadota bacterium]
MNALHIEPARPEGADRLGDLYVASRSAALPFLTEIHGPAQMRVWLRDVLLPRGTTWVARSGDRIVGFMTLDGEEVDQLYLDPLHLRRGIGSALIAHAKTRSPHRLELVTFQRNDAARAFYEAHGFVPFRFGDGTHNEEGEPDVFYEWRS